MRILMLNNEFPPLGGGTATVNHVLCEHFAGMSELSIDLITSSAGNTSETTRLSERIRLYRVPVGNRNLHHASNTELIKYALRAFSLGRKLHRDHPYDCCFAWSGLPAGALALALKKLTGLRYVVRICGADIPGYEERYRWLYPLLTHLIRLVWRNAELLIVKCEEEHAVLRRLAPKAKIMLIRNGVDQQMFHCRSATAKQGTCRIICVARLIERKKQRHVIEAIEQLIHEGVDVSLDCIGGGDLLEEYRREVRSRKLEKYVRFLNYVSHEEIPSQYAAADVFVLASANEAMSVSLLEAMAAGLPIVTTRTGGTSVLVEHGVNGFLFDHGDIKALAGHLRTLASHPSLVQQMSAASRQRSALFSWEHVADCYRSVFCDLNNRRA